MLSKLIQNKRLLKRFGILIVVVEGLAIGLFALSTQYTIGVNTTDSLDGHIYLVYKRQQPGKNDIAAFRPPENPYIDKWIFLKIVKGVGGDQISWAGRNFYINDDLLGSAKETTKTGDPLVPSGGGEIEDNHFFVWTPHRDSFDSRYELIGLVDKSQIIGKAVKLL